MRIVVTGIGPRCGTSAMMKRFVDKGYSFVGSKFPAHGVHEYNPEGYYELELDDAHTPITLDDYQCVKLWPGWLHLVQPDEIDLLIIMVRKDRKAQIKSIVEVGRAEGLTMSQARAGHMICVAERIMTPNMKTYPHVIIYTEEPDTVEAYL